MVKASSKSPPRADASSAPTTLRPSTGWSPPNLAEIWRYRELLYFLVWRDIKIRYKQTALGASWAILQPFLTMVIFSLFFGELAGIPSEGIPYPLFAYAGLLPWTYFANSVSQASNSVVANASLITKVYFPRLAVPMSGVLGGIPDFVLSFLVLIGMMIYYGQGFSVRIAYLPLLLILALLTALAVGVWLAALNVRFRDVKYVVPFLIQSWLFATPVAYSSSLLGEPWRTIYGVNPMVGVVEGFRWALVGTETAPGPIIAVSSVAVLLTLAGGLWFFRRTERNLADII